MQNCVEEDEFEGRVDGLGEHQKISMGIVASTQYNIQCRNTGAAQAPTASYQNLLDTMPAGLSRVRFGTRGPNVDVALPRKIYSSKHFCHLIAKCGKRMRVTKCELTIYASPADQRAVLGLYSIGTPDEETFYNIYLAATAVAVKCVTGKKWGIASGLGKVVILFESHI
ncbi:hypothetical protein ACLMJK_003908 [Lecanora helva]